MNQLTDFSNLSVIVLVRFEVYRDENNTFCRRLGQLQAQQLLDVPNFRLCFVTHVHGFVRSIKNGLDKMERCCHYVATMFPEGTLYERGLPLMS